ncbi:hypothetical protein Hokovirus_3_38 [Hokovirus HKV1]|uniref:Uncharacterized protein n=1 Tax=Hokovirus HKV1 TaxID=1977638 RepID=A0A1V0SGB8_9VIRU|nr:hypothetical protein Hokovirus_3_38 [Hokovirus HKV1]
MSKYNIEKIENLRLKCIDFDVRIRNSPIPLVVPNCRQSYHFDNDRLICRFELVNTILLNNKVTIEYLINLQKYTFQNIIETCKYDILNIYDDFINTDNIIISDIIFLDNKYYYTCEFNEYFSILVKQVMQHINYVNLLFPNITNMTTITIKNILYYEKNYSLSDYLITMKKKEEMKKQLLEKAKYNNIINNIKKEYKNLIDLKTITDTENFIILCKESLISENIIDIVLSIESK